MSVRNAKAFTLSIRFSNDFLLLLADHVKLSTFRVDLTIAFSFATDVDCRQPREAPSMPSFLCASPAAWCAKVIVACIVAAIRLRGEPSERTPNVVNSVRVAKTVLDRDKRRAGLASKELHRVISRHIEQC